MLAAAARASSGPSSLRARASLAARLPARAGGSRRSLFITTEETPNPATLKFLPGRQVVESETGHEFRSSQAARNSPLARELLRVDGVKGVYLGPDFVSVTKAEDELVQWAQLKPLVFSTIMDFFSKNVPAVQTEEAAKQAVSESFAKRTYTEEQLEVVEMVKELLDSRVRPMARDDGGDVIFKDFDADSGTVFVELVGSCSGCPSSTVTLKNGVENMLRHYIPEVKAVEHTVTLTEEHHLTFNEGGGA